MAQYDVHLYQNIAASGTEFTERPVTFAKGTLITANASNVPTALGVGTNNHVLTADSTTATGLAWKQFSAVPGGSDTHVQYNDTNAFQGNAGFVIDKTNFHLTLAGRLKGSNIETHPTSESVVIGLFAAPNENKNIKTGNIAIGWGALTDVTSGTYNIAIGHEAGSSISTGIGSISIGQKAGRANITSYNIFIGDQAGVVNTLGTNNIYIGYIAGSQSIRGHDNTFIGYRSGRAVATVDAGGNTFIGSNTGYSATSCTGNVFIGANAGYHELGSSTLFIDSNSRNNQTEGRTDALIYGLFNLTPASQLLRINAQFELPHIASATKPDVLFYDSTTKRVSYGAAPSGGTMVYPAAGIALSTGSAWGTSITNNSTNWNAAHTHSTTTTGSVHGSTTVGGLLLRIANNSTNNKFIRVGLDNTVAYRTGAEVRSDIFAAEALHTHDNLYSGLGHTHITTDITSGRFVDDRMPTRLDYRATTKTGDWNNVIENGWYDGQSLTNSPSGGHSWKYVMVIRHQNSSDYVVQTAYDFTSNRMWVRYKAATWIAWSELITDNVAQTISGIKTFSSNVIVPNATAATHAVNRQTGDGRYLLRTEPPSSTITASTTIQSSVQSTYAGKTTPVSSTGAITVTFNIDLSIGFQMTLIRMNTGEVTIAVTGTGATLRSGGSKRRIDVLYEGVTIYKRTATEFILMGALKT